MKTIMLLGVLAAGATAFAASNTFRVNLYQDSVIEGKTVKAGDYKLSIDNGNAVLKQGKRSIELPAREETDASKVASTELMYRDNTNLTEIRIGGTHTRIVFDDGASMHSGM